MSLFIGLIFTITLCQICINLASTVSDDGPIVSTSTGKVEGKYIDVLNTKLSAFLGIPFAEPPLGQRRFSRPEAIKKWDGVLKATQKSPGCMQYTFRDFDWIQHDFKTDEDCLYLNIWTPVKYSTTNVPNKLPVIVWIHGGGYSCGSATTKYYDGAVIAALGNVLVASMNYRVGSFGFLNADIGDAHGNNGLYDQNLALKWIKDNVEQFGGDRNSITLFGESVGGASIASHVISPMSQGLFQRVILESGTTYENPLFVENNVSLNKTDEFAKKLGCSSDNSNIRNKPSEVLSCLRKIDAMVLAKTEDVYVSKFPIYFTPTFGNECSNCNSFFPKSPNQIMKLKEFTQVPVLLGINENEGEIFVNYIVPEHFPKDYPPKIEANQIRDSINRIFPLPDSLRQDIFTFYIGNIENNSTKIELKLSYAIGDLLFNCPTLFFSELADEAYTYYFTYRSPNDKNGERRGVTHFDEMQFVFGHPFSDSERYTQDDRDFSEELIKTWTSFARSGYPSGTDVNRNWPKFNSINNLVFEINHNWSNVLPFPRKDDCEFWRSFITQQNV